MSYGNARVIKIWDDPPGIRMWLFDNGLYYTTLFPEDWSIERILEYGYHNPGRKISVGPEAKLIWQLQKCNCDVCCED